MKVAMGKKFWELLRKDLSFRRRSLKYRIIENHFVAALQDFKKFIGDFQIFLRNFKLFTRSSWVAYGSSQHLLTFLRKLMINQMSVSSFIELFQVRRLWDLYINFFSLSPCVLTWLYLTSISCILTFMCRFSILTSLWNLSDVSQYSCVCESVCLFLWQFERGNNRRKSYQVWQVNCTIGWCLRQCWNWYISSETSSQENM